MYKIKRLYSGEDYTLYEYETLNKVWDYLIPNFPLSHSEIFEVEITGTAQDIIDSLLELLDTYKKYHER